ncbi:nitroreductase family protein [Candidatus Bathyarchaeota archaeon]|nr:nitroreductase family protein [Candidatus Bathyarchaeota archaeon]
MNVYEAITRRRTVRSFKQPISEEQLRKFLLAGATAPSGSNVQPWEFIVIDDDEIITQIAELKFLQSLKMNIDAMELNDPKVIEKIHQQALPGPLPLQMALRQRNAYQNCTVVAVCNKKGHGIGRKPWMNVENIASTWMCIENMVLAATEDGLGMQISILREQYKIIAEKLLNIPEDYELATIVMFGVPTEITLKREMGATRRDFSWLHQNKFNYRSE